jgi:hypothetical protein
LAIAWAIFNIDFPDDSLIQRIISVNDELKWVVQPIAAEEREPAIV